MTSSTKQYLLKSLYRATRRGIAMMTMLALLAPTAAMSVRDHGDEEVRSVASVASGCSQYSVPPLVSAPFVASAQVAVDDDVSFQIRREDFNEAALREALAQPVNANQSPNAVDRLLDIFRPNVRHLVMDLPYQRVRLCLPSLQHVRTMDLRVGDIPLQQIGILILDRMSSQMQRVTLHSEKVRHYSEILLEFRTSPYAHRVNFDQVLTPGATRQFHHIAYLRQEINRAEANLSSEFWFARWWATSALRKLKPLLHDKETQFAHQYFWRDILPPLNEVMPHLDEFWWDMLRTFTREYVIPEADTPFQAPNEDALPAAPAQEDLDLFEGTDWQSVWNLGALSRAYRYGGLLLEELEPFLSAPVYAQLSTLMRRSSGVLPQHIYSGMAPSQVSLSRGYERAHSPFSSDASQDSIPDGVDSDLWEGVPSHVADTEAADREALRELPGGVLDDSDPESVVSDVSHSLASQVPHLDAYALGQYAVDAMDAVQQWMRDVEPQEEDDGVVTPRSHVSISSHAPSHVSVRSRPASVMGEDEGEDDLPLGAEFQDLMPVSVENAADAPPSVVQQPVRVPSTTSSPIPFIPAQRHWDLGILSSIWARDGRFNSAMCMRRADVVESLHAYAPDEHAVRHFRLRLLNLETVKALGDLLKEHFRKVNTLSVTYEGDMEELLFGASPNLLERVVTCAPTVSRINFSTSNFCRLNRYRIDEIVSLLGRMPMLRVDQTIWEEALILPPSLVFDLDNLMTLNDKWYSLPEHINGRYLLKNMYDEAASRFRKQYGWLDRLRELQNSRTTFWLEFLGEIDRQNLRREFVEAVNVVREALSNLNPMGRAPSPAGSVASQVSSVMSQPPVQMERAASFVGSAASHVSSIMSQPPVTQAAAPVRYSYASAVVQGGQPGVARAPSVNSDTSRYFSSAIGAGSIQQPALQRAPSVVSVVSVRSQVDELLEEDEESLNSVQSSRSEVSLPDVHEAFPMHYVSEEDEPFGEEDAREVEMEDFVRRAERFYEGDPWR